MQQVDRTYVFYRDKCNYKSIIFEGTREECEKWCEENNYEWQWDGDKNVYELEVA